MQSKGESKNPLFTPLLIKSLLMVSGVFYKKISILNKEGLSGKGPKVVFWGVQVAHAITIYQAVYFSLCIF